MAAQELEGLAWRTRLLMAGVGLSAFTSGTLAALSLITVPALLAAHTPTNSSTSSLLTSWRHTLDRGVKICPPLAIAATLVHLSNAYASHTINSAVSGYSARTYSLLAAASTIAIVPFTVVVMAGTNGELFRREKAAASAAPGGRGGGGGGSGVDPGSSRELVGKWGRLNAVRALLPAVGAVVACFTL